MKTIVFVHGMFITRHCWDNWIARLEPRGFHCLAPPWPLRDAEPAELRARHPDAALGKLTMDEVVESYAAIVQTQPEPPLLVGHSLGGLMVQLLLQRGLGRKGVAIDSAPPRGILPLEWSVVKANWPTISPFVSKSQPVLLTVEQFRYAFAHTLPVDEVAKIWERQVVPESRQMRPSRAARPAPPAPPGPHGASPRTCAARQARLRTCPRARHARRPGRRDRGNLEALRAQWRRFRSWACLLLSSRRPTAT